MWPRSVGAEPLRTCPNAPPLEGAASEGNFKRRAAARRARGGGRGRAPRARRPNRGARERAARQGHGVPCPYRSARTPRRQRRATAPEVFALMTALAIANGISAKRAGQGARRFLRLATLARSDGLLRLATLARSDGLLRLATLARSNCLLRLATLARSDGLLRLATLVRSDGLLLLGLFFYCQISC